MNESLGQMVMASSERRQQLEAELATVEQLLSRISYLENRATKPDETLNAPAPAPAPAQELIEERQSSSQGAGSKSFTKERSAVGARMTVASSSSDVRKREIEEGSASKRPKLSFENGEQEEDGNQNADVVDQNVDSGGEDGGSMSTLHSSEEASSQRRDEHDRYKPCWGRCLKILDDIKITVPDSWVFFNPVLELWPELENYTQMISRPMDLGTARKRVEGRVYGDPSQFAADVRLTFENAIIFNQKGSLYHTMAKRLLQRFNMNFKPVEVLMRKCKLGGSKFRPAAPPPAAPLTPPAATPVAPVYVPEPPVAKAESPVYVPQVIETPIATPNRSVKWDPEPVRTYMVEKHEHRIKSRSGKKLNPRLGRQTSSNAYGGIRPLTMKEKTKLKDLVESFPEDRMKKVWEMLGEDAGTEDRSALHELELDLDNLNEATLFNIYRLAMNWQKSKNKVLHKKLRALNEHDSGSQLQLPGDSSENIDIGGDSPVIEQQYQQPLEELQQRDEEQEQRKAEESSSGSDTSDSDTSSSESDSDDDRDGDSTGSSSSDNDSDREEAGAESEKG